MILRYAQDDQVGRFSDSMTLCHLSLVLRALLLALLNFGTLIASICDSPTSYYYITLGGNIRVETKIKSYRGAIVVAAFALTASLALIFALVPSSASASGLN